MPGVEYLLIVGTAVFAGTSAAFVIRSRKASRRVVRVAPVRTEPVRTVPRDRPYTSLGDSGSSMLGEVIAASAAAEGHVPVPVPREALELGAFFHVRFPGRPPQAVRVPPGTRDGTVVQFPGAPWPVRLVVLEGYETARQGARNDTTVAASAKDDRDARDVEFRAWRV